MINSLFTAFALIAAGQADVPPASKQPATTRDLRYFEARESREADRTRRGA